MYDLRLAPKVLKDLVLLKKENAKLGMKVWELILDIFKDPFSGLGKPEALKGNMQGYWSRRITDKHRLIYRIVEEDKVLEIISCYGHYGDK